MTARIAEKARKLTPSDFRRRQQKWETPSPDGTGTPGTVDGREAERSVGRPILDALTELVFRPARYDRPAGLHRQAG